MKRNPSETKKVLNESLFKSKAVILTVCRVPLPATFAKLLRLSKVIRGHVWHFLIDPNLHDIKWYEAFMENLYRRPLPSFPLDEPFMDSHPVFYPDNPLMPRGFRLGKILLHTIVKNSVLNRIKLQVTTIGYLNPNQLSHIKQTIYTCESSQPISITVCREWYFVALALSIAMDTRLLESNQNRAKQPISLHKDKNLLF